MKFLIKVRKVNQSYFITLLIILFSFILAIPCAASQITNRVPEFSNTKVNVWQTIIYPGTAQILKLHRHQYNRVIVAFNEGTFKIKNNKGKVHYLKLAKNKPYYLTKDIPGELHTDENISHHPIKVLVIELKNQ